MSMSYHEEEFADVLGLSWQDIIISVGFSLMGPLSLVAIIGATIDSEEKKHSIWWYLFNLNFKFKPHLPYDESFHIYYLDKNRRNK